MAPGLFSDAAVEVTVHPLLGPQMDNALGVGLVLHSPIECSPAQIVFSIAPDGYWQIGPATVLDDGYDHLRSGGHLDPTISNRLTVIMRGNQYICYVNDTFLGIYQAGSAGPGQVGISVRTLSQCHGLQRLHCLPLVGKGIQPENLYSGRTPFCIIQGCTSQSSRPACTAGSPSASVCASSSEPARMMLAPRRSP